MASTDIYISLSLDIIKSLKISNNSLFNLSFTFYLIGIGISMLIFGFSSDSIGRKKSLIISIFIYSFFSLLLCFSENIYYFVIYRFFQGIGGGAGTVIGRLILKDYFDKKNQINIMSSLSIGQAIAPAIAPNLGTIIANFFNWRYTFFFSFILGLLVLFLTIFFLKETLDKKNIVKYNPLNNIKLFIIEPFYNFKFLGCIGLISFSWAAYFTFISVSSIWFLNGFQYNKESYSILISVISIGYFSGTLLFKKLSKKLNPDYIIKLGISIFAFFSLIFLVGYLIDNEYIIILSIFFIRFGIGGIMPISQVEAMNSGVENVGWSMGMLFCIEFIIGGIYVYVFGYLESFNLGFGNLLCFFISSVLLYLSFIIYRLNIKNIV
jgi:DHA1 family bicyclomycin/chloramphenicol resistance-like MFS transporter